MKSEIQLPVHGGSPPYRWSVAAGSLPPGTTVSSSGVLTGSPLRAGYYQFTVTVTDGSANIVNVDFVWEIDEIRILTPEELPAVHTGQPVYVQLEALSSAPGYMWALQNPDCELQGLTLSPGGILAGAPKDGFGCDINVTDAIGRRTHGFISLNVFPPGSPGVTIFGPILATGSVGSFLSTYFGISAASPYALSLAAGSELPAGLTLHGNTLSGYPAKAGAYAFQVQLTDGFGGQDTTRVYIRVSPLHIVPTLPSGTYNQPFSYQFRTLEPQQPLLWTVAPADRLPAGLKLSPQGLLSGVPGETGPFTFTVRANDAAVKVTLTIDSGTAITDYLTSARPDFPAGLGKPYSYTLSTTYADTRFSLLSGALPSGLTLSNTGVISGTPATAGIFTFSVRLDGGEGRFGVAVVTIRVGGTLGGNFTLPTAALGKPYAAMLRGGALAAGESLPPGLTLGTDGTLSGVPTAAWFYRFSVLLADPIGANVVSTYMLEILGGS